LGAWYLVKNPLMKRHRHVILAWLLVALSLPAGARADVVFTGLNEAQEKNVRTLLPLARLDCDTLPWRVERLFRDADRDIHVALESLGYYSAKITKTLERNDACWIARFTIEAGEPVVFRNVEILIRGEANNDAMFNRRVQARRIKSGEVLHHGRYSRYKRALIDTAIARGYFEAEFTRAEITVDADNHAADLALILESGPRYRFGDVTFTEGVLRDSLLQGYSDIESGDAYDVKAVNELYEALSGSSYFSSVSISTDPLNTEAKVAPVNVTLAPGLRRIYSVGAGFATDTGPQGRLGFNNRRKNDKGHQLEARLFGSKVRSEITTAYRFPLQDPRNEWFSIGTGLQHEETDTSESDTFKVGILESHNIGKHWLETRYLDYVREDFTIADQEDTESTLVILGINREKVIGREMSRSSNGHRLTFDLRGASDSLGSDTSFLQFRGSALWIHSLSEKSRVLARARIGATLKDEFSELPASVRFFAGGDNSIRGYELESLGPLDADGAVIGGSHLVEASLEVDRLFRPQWAVAAFVDTGSAFSGSSIELSTGVGIGLRWYSPLGPIRLDFAHPLDDPDHSLRVHITLGPEL
jgi:translocation and assembly module TamA